MSYYPDQRIVSSKTGIRRHVLLPEEAVGTVRTQEGKRVDIREVVASGALPARHVILEGAEFFGLKKPENLSALMLVNVGDVVEVRQPVAGKSPTRGKRLFSPVKGIVAQVADGRVLIQELPQVIDLEAGVKGRVSSVLPGRGVVIETSGAMVQGVWGNGGRALATLTIEPEEGVESITSDSLDRQYTGSVVVTRRQLKQIGLDVMRDQGFSGIIAPSMDADLRETALKADAPIMLTEGFGAANMSYSVYTLLHEYARKQVTLDAFTPTRWDSRRPEAVINLPSEQTTGIGLALSLQKGMSVRVNRAPHLGAVGKITDLPKTPILLENGLRVACAQLEMLTGEVVFVPLANLEYYGK
jgi:hypothetical protein